MAFSFQKPELISIYWKIHFLKCLQKPAIIKFKTLAYFMEYLNKINSHENFKLKNRDISSIFV